MAAKSPARSFTQRFRVKGGSSRRTSTPEKDGPRASSSRASSTTLTQSTASPPEVLDGQKGTSNIGPLVLSTTPEKNIEFEIWFIHGLTGDRIKTWTHPNGTYWPSLLAEDFPNARVITYGYDANIVRFEKNLQNSSSEGLHSYGQSLAFTLRNWRQEIRREEGKGERPIYFIAHSLGGLVVEQALLICIGPDKSLHPVAAATAGILFMGTPHQGSHLAKWASAFGRLVPDSIRSVNQQALSVLMKDSEVCRGLENGFQEQAKNGRFRHVRLFSFYETVKLGGLGGMVVREDSAVLKGDFKCGIHGTHREIVRFGGRGDEGYGKVRGQLVAWLLSERQKGKQIVGRERERERSGGSVIMVGNTFHGSISGATISANQTAAGGDIYYYSGDQPDGEEGSSGSEDEDEGVDEDEC